MPTYRNDGDRPKYTVPPGGTIATEQIIVDSDLTKISEAPLWAPLKFSQTYNLTAGATQEISVPTPNQNMYVAILKNTCGVTIYNGTSATIVSLLPNQLVSFETHGKVETLTIEAQNDGEVSIAISETPIEII